MAERLVEYNGKQMSFPSDATDDEIAEVLSSMEGESAPSEPAGMPWPKGSTPPTDEAIQANVEEFHGGRNTPGAGHPYAQIGRGIQDTLGRWASNAGAMLGSTTEDGPQTPERAAELNKFMQPQTPLEAVGSTAPALGVAASTLGLGGAGVLGGMAGNAAVGGGLTALETGDPAAALAGGGASAVLGGLGGIAGKAVDKLTPNMKWGIVNSILKQGGLGALVGAYAGRDSGIEGAAKDAALGALLQRVVGGGNKEAVSKITKAAKTGSESNVARLLWRLLPPAVAEGLSSEPSYDSVDRLMNADSPKALESIARKRQQAESVLR